MIEYWATYGWYCRECEAESNSYENESESEQAAEEHMKENHAEDGE